MRAVIIAVGDELTCGATADTNSAYLARRLSERGIATVRHVVVGDDAGAIAQAVSAAAAKADLVVITGGLGPTPDDLTRQGLAQALAVKLREDRRQAERISAFFAARHISMKPSVRAQALLPAGAEPIDNDCGTAPGIAASLAGVGIFALPGPPREMQAMFETKVLAQLPPAGGIACRLVHTFGAGESDVAEKIADLMAAPGGSAIGTTVQTGIVTVRVTANAESKAAAEAAAEADAARIRRRLGELVFGAGGDTLAAVVGQALRSAGDSLAVAESCTAGMLGEMLTAVPGASRYFLGGVVAYADEAKTALLGVPAELIRAHGAVSEPVAQALAAAAAERFGADWGIGITGIAGPTGGSSDKPVGLVFIGLAGPGGVAAHRCIFPGSREVVRRRASLAAMNYLRLALAATSKAGPEREIEE